MCRTGPRHMLTYVGHATLLLQVSGTRLLTDPFLRNGIAHIRRRVPAPDPAALADLDAILVSHAHHDHLDRWARRRGGRACPFIVPRGGGRAVARAGVREVIELDPGGSVSVGAVHVDALSLRHDGRRLPLGGRRETLGYVVRGASTFFFAGDTD